MRRALERMRLTFCRYDRGQASFEPASLATAPLAEEGVGLAPSAVVRWRTDTFARAGYNLSMETSTSNNETEDTDEASLASAVWILAATAWFVMAVLFVGNGIFSAVLLLIIALICLPGMRAAFTHKTGMRITGLSTVTAIAALAVSSFTIAGRNMDMRQSSLRTAASTGTQTESTLDAGVAGRMLTAARLRSSSVAVAENAP